MTNFFYKFGSISALELLHINAHVGENSSVRNHALSSYVCGISRLYDEKNNISSLHDIIDLDKTVIVIKQARNFLKKFSDSQTILWVTDSYSFIENATFLKFRTDYGFSSFCWQKKLQFFYIDKKSCYGLLSNFLNYYFFPNKKFIKNNNMLLFQKNCQKMFSKKQYFFTLNTNKRKPDIIFFFDIEGYQFLLEEALQLDIPSIGFCSTATKIKNVFPTYTIVLNKTAYIAKYLILYEIFKS